MREASSVSLAIVSTLYDWMGGMLTDLWMVGKSPSWQNVVAPVNWTKAITIDKKLFSSPSIQNHFRDFFSLKAVFNALIAKLKETKCNLSLTKVQFIFQVNNVKAHDTLVKLNLTLA